MLLIFLNYKMFKYISGNTYKHSIQKGADYILKNKLPIINYAVESNNNPLKIFNQYSLLLNNLPDNRFSIALKLSSVNFDLNYVNRIINMAREKEIKVIIDAEDSYNNNTYQKCMNELIYFDKTLTNLPDKQFRKTFKTYQMYRKDSLDQLTSDMSMCKKLNIPFNAKLVRGAYWNSEYNNGELFTNKNDTDNSYNNAIFEIYNNSKNQECDVILATHNEFSAKFGKQLNKDNIFTFAHLQGMKEKFYDDFSDKVYVYIPYGPYSQMIPYLSRRLYENLDVIKHAL